MKEYVEIAYDLGFRCDKNGDIISPHSNGKIKGSVNSEGRKSFQISVTIADKPNKRQHKIPVHRLQAYQKFGSAIFQKGIHVRHLDGNPLNNHWDNIEIGSQSENFMDRKPEDRLKTSIFAAAHRRKFSDIEINQIREFHKTTKSRKKTMEKFGISSRGSLQYILKVEYKTKR